MTSGNSTKFVQLHFLTAYPASLLNRDDVGMAKRMPFGPAERIRISSQCLKRHWRLARGEWSLEGIGEGKSVRSREIFTRLIENPLIEEGLSKEVVHAVLAEFQAHILGQSEKAKKKKGDEEESPLKTAQLIVLGHPEIDFIKEEARTIAGEADGKKDAVQRTKKYFKDKEKKKNLRALRNAAGLDAALFGRMVTSDILARGDAAVHVAHAFTVNAEQAESDYFTAVDDLVQETGEMGSGHINETELTTGLFYGYVVVDVPQLVCNLEGVDRENWKEADRGLTSRVVEHLVHIVAKVSPGAKLGSTAPYAYAQLVMVEDGSRQPRTMANAFLQPVDPRTPAGLVAGAASAMSSHLDAFDRMYGKGESRVGAAMVEIESPGWEDVGSVDEVASWAGNRVKE